MSAVRLSPLDASFLEIEEADDSSHMHVGWAMLFDPLPKGRPTVAAIRRLAAARLATIPRFTQRLSAARTGGLSWPSWEDDPLFDLGNHVRHARLPAPGGEPELLDWLADFYSHRLDRARPLWELTLIEGLAGRRWALAFKAHHCLIDGASGSVVTLLMLDSTPGGCPAIENPDLATPASDAPGLRSALVRGGRAGIGVLLHPRRLGEMLERSRALADLALSELSPAPHTSLNEPIGASRRLAVVHSSLADIKAIKRSLGGTVNDVVLAATAGGLRELLRSREEDLPEHGLRAMVPVSVRGGSEQLSLGNRVSSLFVDLPVAEPDALTRYRKTAAAAEELKGRGQSAGTEAVLDLAALAPPVVHAAVARLSYTPRLFNLTVTNVPGAQATLYGLGAPMREILPLVPIFARHSIGIAVVSYDGTVTFGLNGDRGTTSDLGVLADGIESALADLRRLARSRRREPSDSGLHVGTPA